MIPSAANSDYPKFVANQVLTSDNLNDLFGYLDEQERITRTNLLGIGIVCGLQVQAVSDTSDGRFLIITAGSGVTSQGYLVTVPDIKYLYYNQFDAVKSIYYEPFVNIDDKKQKFPLWELKQKGDTEDKDNPFHKLDDPADFLNNKIVLLFVELLETNNKNCDPNSCDDKGTTVTVRFRPLVANKEDVDKYLSVQSGSSVSGNAVLLPDIKMPRYDVASTLLLDSEDVFQAYQKILTKSFILSVKSALSDSWTKLNTILTDNYPTDPFNHLDTQFAFLYDGSISQSQVIKLQYFYDFFSDLLLGYQELRTKAFDVVCECLPDENLFPRHLLLGEAVGFDEMKTKYRTRFIYSPLLCCGIQDAKVVKSLFKRLVLIIANLSVTDTERDAFNQKEFPVKITPSLLGKDPLSEKAIPYYYQVNKGDDPLYLAWNQKKTERGDANQILSYKSSDYNMVDDFVMNPLKYDLEPNNFLRVEGHIGQDYLTVLADLENKKRSNRLPFDVVALSSDTRGIFNITQALSTMDTSGSIVAAFEIMIKHPACFSDLFLALDEWINKLRCCLLENRKYFMALPSFVSVKGASRNLKSNTTDNSFAGTENTIGKLYEEKLKAGTIDNQFCNDIFVDISTNKANYGSALVMMPYKIDNLMSVLPEHITQLNAMEIETKYADLTGSSSRLRTMYASKNVADTMTGVDMQRLGTMLEMNCLVCLFLELRLLVREFLIRLLGLMIRQKLGYYAYTNPGIQHKAGVPVGGTFILVYHEQTEIRKTDARNQLLSVLKKVNTKSGTPAPGIFSGDQPLLSSSLLLDEFQFLQKVAGIKEVPNEVLDKKVRSIKPGIVIADFFVPYLCCSSCPPVAYIFSTKSTEDIVFDIKPRIFLFDDARNYPFITQPPVTTANKVQKNFKSPDILNPQELNLWTDENNLLYLHPAKAINNTLESTLTYKGIIVPITIIKPDAKFTVEVLREPTGSVKLTLLAEDQNTDPAPAYEWMINGNELKQDKPKVEVGADKFNLPVTVLLTLSYTINGNKSSDTQFVTLTEKEFSKNGKYDSKPEES